MTDAFVLGGTRTPFRAVRGYLSHLRLDDLLGMTMRGACERIGAPRAGQGDHAGDEHDEFIRDYTTTERLAARPDQSGTTRMIAGNSSPLTDGVSAIVIASGETAAELAVAGVCIGSGQGIALVIGNPQP